MMADYFYHLFNSFGATTRRIYKHHQPVPCVTIRFEQLQELPKTLFEGGEDWTEEEYAISIEIAFQFDDPGL